MASDQKVIATCGVLVVGTGTVNAVARNQTLPSTRFLVGTGVAFLVLSAMAEAEPDLAKALSIAILTTVVLGEGGGVLSYLNQRGEMDTHKKGGPTPQQAPFGEGGKFTPEGDLEHPHSEEVQTFPVVGQAVPLSPDTLAPYPDLR